MFTRRTYIGLIAGATLAAQAKPAEKENSMFQSLFDASLKDKKGVVLYVKGQTITGAVVSSSATYVELKSREFSRIIVRVDSIDGAAMS